MYELTDEERAVAIRFDAVRRGRDNKALGTTNRYTIFRAVEGGEMDIVTVAVRNDPKGKRGMLCKAVMWHRTGTDIVRYRDLTEHYIAGWLVDWFAEGARYHDYCGNGAHTWSWTPEDPDGEQTLRDAAQWGYSWGASYTLAVNPEEIQKTRYRFCGWSNAVTMHGITPMHYFHLLNDCPGVEHLTKAGRFDLISEPIVALFRRAPKAVGRIVARHLAEIPTTGNKVVLVRAWMKRETPDAYRAIVAEESARRVANRRRRAVERRIEAERRAAEAKARAARARKLRAAMGRVVERVTAALANFDRAGWDVFVPVNLSDFQTEGSAMHNCVGRMGYFEKMANGASILAWAQKGKERIDIEIDARTFEVRQCYTYCNQKPSVDAMRLASRLAETLKAAA